MGVRPPRCMDGIPIHTRQLIELVRNEPMYHWYLTDEDTSFEGVIEAYAKGEPMPIWSGASHDTIWGEPRFNHLFRAFHDSIHMLYDCPFTIDGELKASSIQTELCLKYGFVDLAIIMHIETASQALHFDGDGEFPPQTFTQDRLNEIYGMK